MKTRQLSPFFYLLFEPNCLGNSFLYLKIAKILFHGVSPLVHSGLQNASIFEVKAVRLGFCPVRFRNIHIEENKKLSFTFFIELRINSKILRVIAWSNIWIRNSSSSHFSWIILRRERGLGNLFNLIYLLL